MATTFTSSTLPSIYYDDYNVSNNFHQILFNSGRALQARELTQLQTLIYEELGRFGRNVFKEGAAVSSGGSSINAGYDYIKIASVNSGGAFEDIPVGTVFKNPLTNVEARVLEVVPRDSGPFLWNTLYVQYINTGSSEITNSTTTFGDLETLYDQSGNGYELVTETPNATGKGVRFSVNEGDFFVLGRFVHVNEQSIILSPYSNSVNASVGFKVVQEVVTVNDDESLYDNTGGIVNTSSPGADRYRIRLTLTTQDDVTEDDIFVWIATVENSTITEEIRETDAYAKVEEMLALRTNEESGDYVVNPFTLHMEESEDETKINLILSSGTAYVNGYRVHNSSPVKLELPKPTALQTIENDVVPLEYGNYFLVDDVLSLPALDYSVVNISTSTTDPSTSIIGTARVRALEEDNGYHRLYVFDVQVDSASSLSAARTIGTSSTSRFDLVLEGTQAKLKSTTNNNLLMPTPNIRPKSFATTGVTYSVQRFYTAGTGGNTFLDLNSQLGASESFVDGSLWVVATSTGIDTGATVNISTGLVENLSTSTTYYIYYYVQKTNAQIRTKTSRQKTATLSLQTATDPVNGSTYKYYDFGLPDVYELDSVRNTDSSGIDMLGRFVLDDGQRDNFYADSRLILSQADSAPATVMVNYKHFERGGTGDFYTAQSYDVAYDKIPTHTLQSGEEVQLFNYVDFRPDKNDGTFSNIHYLPRNSTNMVADITYYLARSDKVLVTQEGDIQVLMGQQALDPQFKSTPDNSIEIYRLTLNPNTLDENDISVVPVEHKHYTMEDIGQLENKIDQLEEFTKLSILELQEQLRRLLDSDGNERAKVGIQVDAFIDQTNADTKNPDFRASLDPASGIVRPMIDERNVRLVWDSEMSTNITKMGDNVYLSYDSEQWAYQSLASRYVKINPFGLVDNVGVLKMSPSSDEWKESKEEAEKAISGANAVDAQQAFLFNNWQWNWTGRTVEDCEKAYIAEFGSKATNPRAKKKNKADAKKFCNNISRVVSSDTLRQTFEGRAVDVALIPWMRSRKVYFKAQGLTPNTKFTPFFDGQDVSQWCREEAEFIQWSDRNDDIGDQYRYSSLTEHPDGSSDLIADENGEVIGSFFIPNIRPVYYVTTYGKKKKKKTVYTRFRAGIREFKLLDIDTNDWSSAGSKCFTYYTALGAWDRRWRNFWNLRGWDYVLPWAYLPNFPNVYTPKELETALDAVTASQIGITSPQLSGVYGPETNALTYTGLATLDASGEMSQVLSDYISVNQNQYAGSQTNVRSLPQNPLAQTFYVDNPYGLVLTKVSLFFRKKDSGNLPVSIHIRPVVDGKPSNTTIVPDSHVFLNPSQVTAIGTDPQLSTIQSRPTDFEFDEPIYLQPWTNYAIVVTSQSTEYELFSAKTKEYVYGSTSRTITTQPAPGSLFLPQNGVYWLESKDQDLMFKLTRAKFSLGGGSLIMTNSSLPDSLLTENPIKTTSGSSYVYVRHFNHGLQPGDKADLSDATAVNGITASQLNDTVFTVDSADLYGYTVQTAGSATGTGYGGGDKVLSRHNAIFSIVNTQVETMVPNYTSIDVSSKMTSGKYISGSNTRFVQDANYTRISLNQNVTFEKPRAIYNATAETDAPTIEKSAYVKIDLKSSNDYVSPIIDLQRASLILVGYCMDDPNITPHIEPVEDTQPYGGSTGMQHITAPVVLPEPAVGMNVNVIANLPDGSGYQVYVRTAGADENINDARWLPVQADTPIPNDNGKNFYQANHLAGGEGGNLTAFQQSQVKIVGTGLDMPLALKGLNITWLGV